MKADLLCIEGYMHEDDLPEMTDDEYSEWYRSSWLMGGVRVGPVVTKGGE